MSNKTRGLVLIAGGGLLALISLTADAIGMGAYPAFGWKQIVGVIVGVVIAVSGLRDVRG